MNPYEIIDKYYPENTQQGQILVIHSLAVSGKAMKMLDAHPELRLNRSFVKEAALLHDIGIFQTDAPTIQCFGTHPYIAHGYLGAEILRAEGFPQHALVCERHTGFPIDGQLHIGRGGVFNFYQFEQPISDRLTDKEWRIKLGMSMDDNDEYHFEEVEQPAWTQSFIRHSLSVSRSDMGCSN